MAADPVFIDTNVLIYATRRTASERAAAQAALARLEGEGRGLWISFQILREYLAAVTRPQTAAPRCRSEPQSGMCNVSDRSSMSQRTGRSC
jgi:predicted nucleic acid-binding protein